MGAHIPSTKMDLHRGRTKNCTTVLVQCLTFLFLGMVVNAFDLGTQEAEAGGASEFRASQGYTV